MATVFLAAVLLLSCTTFKTDFPPTLHRFHCQLPSILSQMTQNGAALVSFDEEHHPLLKAPLQRIDPSTLHNPSEAMGYACGLILHRIGKNTLWMNWVDEESDLLDTEEQRHQFWSEKLQDAQAAEKTQSLTAEERAVHDNSIENIKTLLRERMSKLNIMSTWSWDHMMQGLEHAADEKWYWEDRFRAIMGRKAKTKSNSKDLYLY